MKRRRTVFPLLVLVGGLGFNVIPGFATAEFAKQEKKPCGTCHTSKTPKKGAADVNDVGKCYAKEKSMAKCASAVQPNAAALVPAQYHGDHAATVIGAQKSMSTDMPEACKSMMAKRDQMMAEMKSMDVALDQKVAAMNAATGSSKMEAMASVINELVSQRMRKEQRMMTMQSSMTEHMGSHMMAGKSGNMNCPMMNTASTSKPGGH